MFQSTKDRKLNHSNDHQREIHSPITENDFHSNKNMERHFSLHSDSSIDNHVTSIRVVDPDPS